MTPTAERPTREDRSCPKCIGPLRFEKNPPGPIGTCGDCKGLWVDTRYLFEFPDEYGIGTPVRNVITSFDPSRSKETELLCPFCPDRTIRLQRVGKIELEWCPGCNGIFFDPGEIERWIDSNPDKRPGRLPAPQRGEGSGATEFLGAAAGGVVELIGEILLSALD